MLKQTYKYEKIKDLILLIHKDSIKLNIILTGAGFSFLNWLLMCEGASNTILKVTIPYNEETLRKLIGNHQIKKNESRLVSKIISSKLAKLASPFHVDCYYALNPCVYASFAFCLAFLC